MCVYPRVFCLFITAVPITKLGVYNKGQTNRILFCQAHSLALSRNSSRKPSAASRFHAGRTEIRYKFFLGFVSAFLRGIVLFQIFSSRVTKTAALRLVAENAEECFNY